MVVQDDRAVEVPDPAGIIVAGRDTGQKVGLAPSSAMAAAARRPISRSAASDSPLSPSAKTAERSCPAIGRAGALVEAGLVEAQFLTVQVGAEDAEGVGRRAHVEEIGDNVRPPGLR